MNLHVKRQQLLVTHFSTRCQFTLASNHFTSLLRIVSTKHTIQFISLIHISRFNPLRVETTWGLVGRTHDWSSLCPHALTTDGKGYPQRLTSLRVRGEVAI